MTRDEAIEAVSAILDDIVSSAAGCEGWPPLEDRDVVEDSEAVLKALNWSET